MALKPDDRYIVQYQTGIQWLLEPGNGSTRCVEKAHHYRPGERFYYLEELDTPQKRWNQSTESSLSFMLILPDDPNAPIPLERLFNANQIELLRAAPRSDAARALVMSKAGQMPPEELEGFEALKEWIEKNSIRKPVSNNPAAGAKFSMELEWSATEYGTARYTAGLTASQQLELTVQDIADLAEGCGGVGELFSAIEAHEEENHTITDFRVNTGEYDHTDHEQGEDSPEGSESYVAQPDATKQRMIEFLRANLPDVAEELGVA